MKHTKGPWHVKKWQREHANDGFVTAITDSRGHGLFTSCQMGSHPKTQANAHLIAAAPDLLEACQLLVKADEEPDDEYNDSRYITAVDVAMTKAKQAVQKATAPARANSSRPVL